MTGRTGLLWSLLVVFAAVAAVDGAAPPKKEALPPYAPPPPPPPSTVPFIPEPPPIPDLLSPFKRKIRRNSPAKALLPAAPASSNRAVYLGDDTTRVPELVLEAPSAKKLTAKQWTNHTAQMLARADYLNGRQRDGFVKTLVRERRDLLGLSFVMGDDCRLPRDRQRALALVSRGIREARNHPKGIWKLAGEIETSSDEVGDSPRGRTRDEDEEIRLLAHLKPAMESALIQILGADGSLRSTLVRALAGIPTVSATRELARLAVFAPEAKVRLSAIEALAVRRERDYTTVLLDALNYPMPAVAGRSAEAIVALERKDLMPRLVEMLEDSDPREPKAETTDGKKVMVTREVVRVNHHKNCLLCHAPVDPAVVKIDKKDNPLFVAPVPSPTEKLPEPTEYYSPRPSSGLLVRIDVTYLRQDFSLMQPVKDAALWPEMQRFDFLVRKRVLTDAEAKDLRERLGKRDQDELSPYQKAAVKALRELTGRDLPAKAEVWRKLLKLPAKTG